MAETKYQHYVPRFYLRRFARKDDDQIAVVDLWKDRTPKLQSVSNTAVMTDFYTIENDDGTKDRSIEEWLQDIENDAAGAFERLTTAVLPMSSKDRQVMSLYLALQLGRTPGDRRRIEAMADLISKVMLSVTDEDAARRYLTRDGNSDPSDEDVAAVLAMAQDPTGWEASSHPNEHLTLMVENATKQVAPLLFKRHWFVGRLPEPGLLTTDNPVVMYVSDENYSPDRGFGVGNADEIWFPLDSCHMLMLAFPDPRLPEGLLSLPMDIARNLNQQVIGYTHERMFMHPDMNLMKGLRIPRKAPPLFQVEGAGVGTSVDGVNQTPRRMSPRRAPKGST